MNNCEPERKKKRKTDPVQLERAIHQVKIGKMMVRQASQNFGIAKTTIGDHVTGKRTQTRHGPEPYISKDLEDQIAAWLIKMAWIGYGQTKDQLFDKVQQLDIQLNIRTPFKDN